jgi:outer membrane lipoprotein-sorting protein
MMVTAARRAFLFVTLIRRNEMKIRTIVRMLFVTCITASAALTVSAAQAAEDPTAAGLFKKMQTKVAGAKTVSVTVNANITNLLSLNTDVKTASENRANVVMESKKTGGNKTHRVHIISDGMQQKSSTSGSGRETTGPADPHLGDNLVATLTHTGVLAMYLPVSSQRGGSTKVTDRLKASEFEFGE